jgi:plasmid stability protein
MQAGKIQNHRYSIDIPDRIYTALKIKAAVTKKSVRDIILTSLKEEFGDDFNTLPTDEQKEILSFTSTSAKIFGEEWNSTEDDKAFATLQKYKKNSENS